MKINYKSIRLKAIANSAFDSAGWELAVAFICGVLTYVSYKSGFGMLFFPMLAVFSLSIFSILINIFYTIKEEITEHLSKK